jgi:hypothetical protein
MEEDKTKRQRRPRRSFFWPLVLIAVGVVFLLSNLGVIEGEEGWALFARLWPLLFIIIGIDSLLQRSGVAGPVFAIGLGTVFLLSNLGWLPWSALELLWRLWPLLLVAVGLDIILARRSTALSILGVVIALVMLGGALWLVGVGDLGGEALGGETINQPLGEATYADVTLSPAVGDLMVDSLGDSDDLVAGRVRTDRPGQIFADYDLRGDTAVYRLTGRLGVYTVSDTWKWDLGLNSQIPMNLDANQGVGEIDLDLVELQVDDLNVSQGIGEITVRLPAGGRYHASVSQAIGQVTVEIPEGLGVRMEVDRALSGLTRPGVLERQGEVYVTPGYQNADARVDLEIDQAIGNIIVRFVGNE